MIKIHLTKNLARDLSLHVRDEINYKDSIDHAAGAMQWYGHEVMIKGERCIFVMELQSRYVMVFCGLDDSDLIHFPDIFQDRLWRDVVAICAEVDEDKLSVITDVVLNQAVEQFYCTGYDASVNAHISQVAHNLDVLVKYDGYPLPVDSWAAMRFGGLQNNTIRKRKGVKTYFNPLEVYRQYWYDLVENTKKDAPLKSIAGLNIPGFSETELNATQKTVTILDENLILFNQNKIANKNSNMFVKAGAVPHLSRQPSSGGFHRQAKDQIKSPHNPDSSQHEPFSNVITVDFKKRR